MALIDINSPEYAERRWRMSGAAENTYPEMALLGGITKIGQTGLTYLARQLTRPKGTAKTFDASKNGFAKGSTKSERKINEKRADVWKEKEIQLREQMKTATTKAEKKEINRQIDHAVEKQKKSEVHWN